MHGYQVLIGVIHVCFRGYPTQITDGGGKIRVQIIVNSGIGVSHIIYILDSLVDVHVRMRDVLTKAFGTCIYPTFLFEFFISMAYGAFYRVLCNTPYSG